MTAPRPNLVHMPPIWLFALVLAGCGRLDTGAPKSFEMVVAQFETETAPWGQWRGGSAQAVASGNDFPVQWSADEHIAWSTAIEGAGHSSPVLTNDSVFLTTDTLQRGEQSLTLICVARQSGVVRWTRAVAAPQGNTHDKNRHASATAATNGKWVFVSFGQAGLYCFDVDGHFRWRAHVGNIRQKWGFASSPVLHQNLVILLCDNQVDSFIAAYDQNTGRQVWKTKRNSQGSWTTPLLVTAQTPPNGMPPTRAQLIVNGGGPDGSPGAVTSYNPRTGEQRWRVSGTSDIACPTALYADGRVISMSGGNGPIMAIRADGAGDATNTHIAWRQPVGGPYVPTGVALNGRLFVLTDGGRVSCHRLSDGELLWRERLRGSFTASLTAAGNRIYAVSENGDVYVFAAADAFELLGLSRLHQRCLATPAFAEGAIFIRTTKRLLCIAKHLPVNVAAAQHTKEKATAAIAKAESREAP